MEIKNPLKTLKGLTPEQRAVLKQRFIEKLRKVNPELLAKLQAKLQQSK